MRRLIVALCGAALLTAGCATGRVGEALVIGVGVADLLSSTTLKLCRDGVIEDEMVCSSALATQALSQSVRSEEHTYWTQYLSGLEAAWYVLDSNYKGRPVATEPAAWEAQ